MTEYEKVLKLLHNKYGWNLTDSLTDTGKKLVKDTIDALDYVRTALLFETCGFCDGNFCKNPKKCTHKTRIYTEPDEITGKQKKTNSFMCMQGYLANGC